MLYSIKNVELLEILNELVSIQIQVKFVRLQDKLGKIIFHEDLKKAFEPSSDTIKIFSENLTKTITEVSNNNNKALENLNNKTLEIMSDRGILATCLMSPLSKITNPENTSQFKLVTDHNSNRVNDLLMKNKIPITRYNNLLTIRDTSEEFELKVDLLKMITNKIYNADLASLGEKNEWFCKRKAFRCKRSR